MNSRIIVPLILALGVTAGAAKAADWPQWRGPHRNGVSQETGLLKEWPAEGPKLAWQVQDLGSGYGTPVVVGSRLYVISNQGPENELLQALEVATGKLAWSARLGKVGNPDQQPAYPGSRTTPTVDGSTIYALGSDGDLVNLETKTGKIRWMRSLRRDFGGQPGVWAYSESPLVDGEALIVTPGGKDATVVALNKKDGSVLWKYASPLAEQAAYSSVQTATIGGVKQYIQFLQKGVVGLDAKSGKQLWRDDRTAVNSPANIPMPVVHENIVYSATGRGGGGAVRLKVNGGAFEPEPLYFAQRMPNSIGGTVRIGDHLYGTTGAGMMCVELATGQVKWQERGIGAASVLLADGRLYLHGESGQVALVEPSPEGYREKGRFSPPNLPERGRGVLAWAYPVVANGRLYVRDLGSLWCYEIKSGQ